MLPEKAKVKAKSSFKLLFIYFLLTMKIGFMTVGIL